MNESLSESLEDYLEAIHNIVVENQVARAKDIAKTLQVSSSSVTGALRSLSKKGLVNYEPYGLITLTDEGKVLAKDVVRRHEVITDFFVKVLSIEKSQAEQAACKIEHVISNTIMERFVQFLSYIETCPQGGARWIEKSGYHCGREKDDEKCKRCITLHLNPKSLKSTEENLWKPKQ